MRKISLGYIKIRIDKNSVSRAMSAIITNDLTYKSIYFTEENDADIVISAPMENHFKNAFSSLGIKAEFSKPFGFFEKISRYFGRTGFFIGLIFLLTALFTSSLFVWDINIDGEGPVDEEEIIDILNECGFSLGTFIPNIDYDKLHNQFLLKSSNISWISVNIDGNVANIKVRENMKGQEIKDQPKYANIVAKYDAQIALIQLFNGKKMINLGDVVKEGDLLISGIIDSKSEGIRYVKASGEVMAYVNKPIEIKIPFSSTEKRYTGEEYKEKNIKIFSKIINFSHIYRNSSSLCDTIEEKRRLTIFGSVEIPIEITETIHREYEEIPITYNSSEVVDIAFSSLRAQTDIALENAELISRTITTSFDDEYFYIHGNLYCLEDIAKEVPFEAENK